MHRLYVIGVSCASIFIMFVSKCSLWMFDRISLESIGRVQVRHMWYDGQLCEVMASDTWKKYTNSSGFENLARVASLCNRAEWAPVSEDKPMLPLNKRKILGDASDAALLRCMEILVKGGAEFFRKDYVKVNELRRDLRSQENTHLILMKYFCSKPDLIK